LRRCAIRAIIDLVLRLTLYAVVAVMLILSMGCAITAGTWERTQTKTLRLSSPVIYGCLVDRSAVPPRLQGIVVAYEVELTSYPSLIGDNQRFYVVIPVDEDRSPAWPFGYRGTERDFKRINEELPERQRIALEETRWQERDFAEGDRAVHSKCFVPLNRTPLGISSNGAAYSMERPGAATAEMAEATLVWYWPAGEMSEGEIRWISDKPNPKWNLLPYPADRRALFVPRNQARPESDRQLNILQAVVATPLCFVADCIYTPLMYWYWHGGGGS
jgi:hypothetical protein